PALFSTTNCCPNSSAILAPTTRATVSVGPPAEKETTIRTGFEGYRSSAFARPEASAGTLAARCRIRRRESFILNLSLPSYHSITSSARASSVGGTSRRGAFAGLRVLSNFKFVADLNRRWQWRAPRERRTTDEAARDT